MSKINVHFRLNGLEVEAQTDPRIHVIDFLRQNFELSSPRVGCEHGVCGACTLRVDGDIVRGCLMLAVQLEGLSVETIEGLNISGEISDLQESFHERNATQCGFCTAGMLMASQDWLSKTKTCSRSAIREHLSGNYCRCTGYEAIIDAVYKVAIARGISAVKEDV